MFVALLNTTVVCTVLRVTTYNVSVSGARPPS